MAREISRGTITRGGREALRESQERQTKYSQARSKAILEAGADYQKRKKAYERELVGKPRYVVPEDSDLTAEEKQVLQDYGPGEINRRRRLAAEKEWSQTVAATEKELEPYRSNGGYDLSKMLEEGYTATKLEDLGFSMESIKSVKTAVATSEELEEFKGEGGYNLVSMLESGYMPEQLINYGFSKDAVMQARRGVKEVKALRKEQALLEQELEPFETEEGYNIVAMMKAGYSKKGLINIGFDKEVVSEVAEAFAEQEALEGELATYVLEGEEGYDVIGLYAAGYTPTKLKGMGFEGDFQESWTEWNALDSLVQDKIRKLGTEGYAQWLDKNFIVTTKGEYIANEDVKGWDPHALDKLVALGVTGYEAWASEEHPSWELAGREPTADEYLAWKSTIEAPTSFKPWDYRNVQLAIEQYLIPGKQALESQWDRWIEEQGKLTKEYLNLYPHLQSAAAKAELLKYAGGIIPPPFPTEVVYPHISWGDIPLGRKIGAPLETLGVVGWITAPIAIASLGGGTLASKTLQIMKWPARTTAVSGIAALTYGLATKPEEINVSAYEKIDLGVVGTDKASEDLKSYIIPADYWGKQTLDTERMLEEGYTEVEVTTLLAQAGYKPTVPLEVYEKIGPKYKSLYTPGSRTMASQSGIAGVIGRGSDWIMTPARLMEEKLKFPGSFPGSPELAGQLAAGMYGYMVPWGTFSRLYPEKGALAATTLIPHFGPTWAYTGLTWEQQPWYGKALGIGFGAAPFVGAVGGAARAKLQLKTVGLKTPIIGKQFPLSGLFRRSLVTKEPWKVLYGPKGSPLITIPKIQLRFPIGRITEGFYKFPVKLRFPVSLKIGRGLQRAGLSAAVEKAAFEAGKAAKVLAAAKKATLKVPVDIRLGKTTAWSRVASRLQTAQQASFAADTKLAEALSKAGLTSKGLGLLEKVTGQVGLKQAILGASKASTTLNKAWTNVLSKKLGSPSYIKALSRLEGAQLKASASTSTLTKILSPRFKYGPSSVFETRWQEIFKEAGRDLKGAQSELGKTSKFTPESRRAELKLAIRNAQRQLESLKAMHKAGVQPELSGYRMKWTQISAGRVLSEGPQPLEGGFGKGGTMTEAQYRAMQDISRTGRQAYETRVANDLKAAREQIITDKARVDAWKEHKWEPGLGKGPSNIQEVVNVDKANLGVKPGVLGTKMKVAVAEPKTQLGLLQDTAPYQMATDWALKFLPKYKTQFPIVGEASGIPSLVSGLSLPFIGISPSLEVSGPGTQVLTQEEFSALVGQGIKPGTGLALQTERMTKYAFEKEYVMPAYKDYLEAATRTITGLAPTMGVQSLVPEWSPIPKVALAEEVELVPGWALTEAEVAAGASPIAARQAAAQRFLSKQKVFAEQEFPYRALWQSPAQMFQRSISLQDATLTRIQNMVSLAPVTKSLTQGLVKTMPLTRTQLQTKTQTLTRTLVDTKVGIKPGGVFRFPLILPPLSTTAKKPPMTLEGLPLAATRPQGVVERAYYTDSKDVKAKSFYNPEAAKKPHGVLETFGKGRGYEIHEDLGQVDVFMDLDKKSVRFEGDGMETDVGKRHPSPGKGLSIYKKKKATGLVRVYA